MEDFYEDFNPFHESNEYLMSDSEEDEPAPEPEASEEVSGEPEEEAAEEAAPEPEAPEEESGEPEAPEEEPGKPETPPAEEPGDGSETMKDLISAIGDLNETITGAVEQEPEELPEEEGGAGGGGNVVVEEPAGVDLTPVVRVLERTNELLEQQSEVLVTQHNDLLQLQANVDFVFLAVAALIGVVLGVAVGKMFHDLWRA